MIRRTDKLTRPGMTMVELLVAVAILVLMVAGVGTVFTYSSRAVRVTQATIETNAAIRATMGRLREDLQSITQDGFLLIADATIGGGPAVPNTPPMLMFTATGRFASQVHPGVVANSALIVYMPVKDQQNGPDILARYVFLLTGDRNAFPDVSLAQLVTTFDPRPDQLDALAREDCLGISLTDLRALVTDTAMFTTRFIVPLQTCYARLNSAPQTIGYDPRGGGWGGIENLWPYLIGGCYGMEVRFCDGRDKDYVTVSAYPAEPAPWVSPEIDDVRDNRGWNGGVPVVGVTSTQGSALLEYIAWDYRNKDLWPDSLQITLYLRDATGRLESNRRYEGIFELP